MPVSLERTKTFVYVLGYLEGFHIHLCTDTDTGSRLHLYLIHPQ